MKKIIILRDCTLATPIVMRMWAAKSRTWSFANHSREYTSRHAHCSLPFNMILCDIHLPSLKTALYQNVPLKELRTPCVPLASPAASALLTLIWSHVSFLRSILNWRGWRSLYGSVIITSTTRIYFRIKQKCFVELIQQFGMHSKAI